MKLFTGPDESGFPEALQETCDLATERAWLQLAAVALGVCLVEAAALMATPSEQGWVFHLPS